MTVAEGMHYNPYFPGEVTGMAQSLFNEVVEYEDGKHSHVAVQFLCTGWAKKNRTVFRSL